MTGLGTVAGYGTLNSDINYDAMISRALTGASIPPPVGGLNYRDELANMDPRDALQLDNIFPGPSYVSIRSGFDEWCDTGETGKTIKTLMQWAGTSGNQLKACVNGKIYDVTTSTASSEVTGLSVNDWQWLNFATAGGNFLVACNGTDAVQNFDGTNWTTPTISGPTSSASFINVAMHKKRLWFVEKDTLDAWYMPVSSIAGVATQFPLGSIFKLGGALVSIGTLSQDAGDGADDYIAFVTSKGEVAVYQGTDVSSSTTWAIVGVYRIDVPIGYRHLLDVGGDLVITTTGGVVSMIKMMKNDRSASQNAAITNKIQNLFSLYVQRYGSNSGWSGVVYPLGNWAVFNVPFSTTQFNQLVMNTITGAWCQFINMNGYSWTLLGDDIYFGGTDGKVYQADTGTYQDNGGVITANVKQAWNYFGSRGEQKLFTLARPVIQTNGSPSVLFIINTDFQDIPPTGTISAGVPSSTLWGAATWGSGVWAGDSVVVTNWDAPTAIGYCASVRMTITTNMANFIYNSCDVQMQRGGAL